MANTTPFMQRRGNHFSLRIAVPTDLRSVIGLREITRTLSTSDRHTAAPAALEYAARVKRLFHDIQTDMSKRKASRPTALNEQFSERWKAALKEILTGPNQSIQPPRPEDQSTSDLDPIKSDYTMHLELPGGAKFVFEDVRPEDHAHVEKMAETIAATLTNQPAVALAVAQASQPAPVPAIPPPIQTAATGEPVPTLKIVIDQFLASYAKKGKEPMLKKHRLVLNMFLEVTGDKPITNIRQTDINNFFDLVQCLPPRWKDACRKHNLSIQALAEIEHETTIGPNSFKFTYLVSVRPFLKDARRLWGDQGFPLGLTTDGIEYTGDREEGEHKQRSFKTDELVRLFTGNEMQVFAQDQTQAHCYWLPHLALFTGARVRELCQLNPQTDILQDEDSVWHLWITKETPCDPRILKSVKTGDPRKVPIHQTLIDLGFLEYVERVKSSGALLLFPGWEPGGNKRASMNAEKWFCELLRETQLRDETPGAYIVGMHAFRHTLLTHGAKRRPALNLTCITGHAQGDLPFPVTGEAVGYITKDIASPLIEKAEILNLLDYGVAFIKPTH